MMLICPTCGHRHGADAFLPEARDVLMLIASVPFGLAALVMRYLGLFSPPSQSLRWSRAADLLPELIGVMEKCELQFNRATHVIPEPAWRPALEEMLDRRIELGKLDSHGYLFKVVITYARNFDAVAEREREVNRMRPTRPARCESAIPGLTAHPPVFNRGYKRIEEAFLPDGNSPRVEDSEQERREAAAAHANLLAMLAERQEKA